jgi:methionyl aminopeptidase
MVTYVDAATAPLKNTGAIRLYGAEAFEGLRRAGRFAADCLDAVAPLARPGVTTQEIDDFVHDFSLKGGALPATLNYRGYNKSVCTSINHVVCHGIPDDRPLKDGDIVNIDVTFILDGWQDRKSVV